MINLDMQIKALIFSFIYGIFVALMINVNYKCLFNKNKIFKLIFNFIFILDISLLYFFLIQNINYGYLHIYFFIVFILGFFLSFKFFKQKIRKGSVKK